MFKKNCIYFIKILFTATLFISLNLALVNSSYIVDKNNICTSEDDKNANNTCCEYCFLDNDLTSIYIKILKVSFFNFKEKYVINVNNKSKLIHPKSNSPPAFIFS